MAECLVCNVCDSGATFGDAVEVARVPCNVRRFARETFTVWRCRQCGSLHCKEHVELARYYVQYPAWSSCGGGGDLWDRVGYRNLVRRWRRAGLRTHHRILDFGCAAGNLVQFLHAHGYGNAAGFDEYETRFRNEALLAQQYDFVIAQDVVEHAEDPPGLVQRLAALLRPGGTLSVGTPNADGIDLRRPDRHLQPLHMPYHRHIPSERGLELLGRAARLVPIRTYRRSYYDTLVPSVNGRFLDSYTLAGGNVVDVAFEPARVAMVLTSPSLLLAGLFGYFYPPKHAQMMLFRSQQER